jgi:hypothetical protein
MLKIVENEAVKEEGYTLDALAREFLAGQYVDVLLADGSESTRSTPAGHRLWSRPSAPLCRERAWTRGICTPIPSSAPATHGPRSISIRPQPAEIERDGVEREGGHFVLVLEYPEQQRPPAFL